MQVPPLIAIMGNVSHGELCLDCVTYQVGHGTAFWLVCGGANLEPILPEGLLPESLRYDTQ